jgi:transposase
MMRLSDLHWERIRHHFPEENIADGRPGRRPVSTRQVLEGTLWILNTGAQMAHAPAVLSELQNGSSPLSDLVPQ